MATLDLQSSRSFNNLGQHQLAKQMVVGRVLADLADEDPRIVAGAADLKYSTHLADFEARHPERFFEFGIAERNMMSAAAGMTSCGLIPYVATFAAFAGILGYEVIKTDLAYGGFPVRVLATHAGISMGFYGTTHHATEDVAALRAVADLTILSAVDGNSMERLLRDTVDHPGPIYFRLGRGREPALYDSPPAYQVGKPYAVRIGTDVLICSTGPLVRASAAAADQLANAGVSVTLFDVHTLKPFDADHVADVARQHAAVLTVEEHNVEGGLGSLVTEALASRAVSVPIYKHGLQDEFSITGPPTHLYRYYGLDPDGIATVAKRLLEQATSGRERRPELLWSGEDRARVHDAMRSRD